MDLSQATSIIVTLLIGAFAIAVTLWLTWKSQEASNRVETTVNKIDGLSTALQAVTNTVLTQAMAIVDKVSGAALERVPTYPPPRYPPNGERHGLGEIGASFDTEAMTATILGTIKGELEKARSAESDTLRERLTELTQMIERVLPRPGTAPTTESASQALASLTQAVKNVITGYLSQRGGYAAAEEIRGHVRNELGIDLVPADFINKYLGELRDTEHIISFEEPVGADTVVALNHLRSEEEKKLFIQALCKWEHDWPWVGMGKFVQEALPPLGFSGIEAWRVVNGAIIEGIATTYAQPNPYKPRFPTTALKLVREHADVRKYCATPS